MLQILHWFLRPEGRQRLLVSFAAAAVVFFSLRARVPFSTQSIATWDTFAVCFLVLTWATILTTRHDKLRAYARKQDVSRFVIFIFVVIASCAGLFAVGFLIRVHHAELHGPLRLHVVLALGTVVFSWSVLHTVFSLHYAHSFYGDSDDGTTDQHAGGLKFPGERLPDYFDFAYFSFVIGMTCQVSDVQVTSRNMRRLTLLHGALSFGFNTVILALLINTVSSLV